MFRHAEAGSEQMSDPAGESGLAARPPNGGARPVGILREGVAAGLEATADLLRFIAAKVTPAPRPVRLRAYATRSTLAVRVPNAEARAQRLAAAKQGLLLHAGGGLAPEEVAQILGVSVAEIDERRRMGILLGMPVKGGVHVYPACQFPDGGSLPGMDRVLRAFRVRNPWTVLSVLVGSSPALGGRSPIEALRSGEVEAVVNFARGVGEQGG
jgi:hypothetical protein